MSARERLEELAASFGSLSARDIEAGDPHAEGWNAGMRQASIDLRGLLAELPNERWQLSPGQIDHIEQLGRMSNGVNPAVDVSIDETGALAFTSVIEAGATQRVEPHIAEPPPTASGGERHG